jgi:ubiquitin C-terminal hydrolase
MVHDHLTCYLLDEWNYNFTDKKTKMEFDMRSPDVPQQANGDDCGVFLLHFAELFMANPSPARTVSNNWSTVSVIEQKRGYIKRILENLFLQKSQQLRSSEVSRLQHTGWSPRGLANLGNTCFFGSAVQIIAVSLKEVGSVVPRFALGEVENPHIDTISCVWSGGGVLAPDHLLAYATGVIKEMRQVGTQQDAAAAFDGLVNSCLRGPYGDVQERAIKTPFDFTTISCVQASCPCAPESSKQENQIMLRLGINERDTNLEEMLLRHFAVEEMRGYKHGCMRIFPPVEIEGPAKKTLTMVDPPLVLAIQLIRFGVTQGSSRKLSNPVDYPLLLPSIHFNVSYILLAVVMHYGTAGSGHYNARVRYGNSWFLCNDGAVSPLGDFARGDGSEYMLFYVRVGV